MMGIIIQTIYSDTRPKALPSAIQQIVAAVGGGGIIACLEVAQRADPQGSNV